MTLKVDLIAFLGVSYKQFLTLKTYKFTYQFVPLELVTVLLSIVFPKTCVNVEKLKEILTRNLFRLESFIVLSPLSMSMYVS